MATLTTRSLTEKENKNLRIHKILRDKKEVSRADLTAITRINPVSISNYTNSFIKHNLVVEREIGTSSGGRPPILLELKKDAVCVIGVHVEGSAQSVRGTVVDVGIKKIFRVKDTFTGRDVLGSLRKIVAALKGNIPSGMLQGIGISFDTVPDNVNAIEYELENEFQIRTYTCAGSLAAAYGEVMLIDTYAGEGVLYSYGDRGDCVFLENFEFAVGCNSGDACYLRPWDNSMSLVAHARGIQSEKEIYAALRKKDPYAIGAAEFTGLNLGVRLAYLVNVFNPRLLIIGGNIQAAGSYFIEPIRRSIERLALAERAATVKAIYSTIDDEDAVSLGAAALVIRELFIGA
ncbi:MAG: ROK family protein [Candidatus Omnitrophica bacterium]|nr:ROK family protein [Candidatus Omnitrophota bacterium]